MADFNIGEGLKRIEAYKNTLAKKRIAGGVYNAATVGGFRDFNLYNNYIRFEDRELGRKYSTPEWLEGIQRDPFYNNTVLSDVGGLIGFTDRMNFLGRTMYTNVSPQTLEQSIIAESVGNPSFDYGNLYLVRDLLINKSADSTDERAYRFKEGLSNYTANHVYTENGKLVDTQNSEEINKRGFKEYSEDIAAGGDYFLDLYEMGYREKTIPNYTGIIDIKSKRGENFVEKLRAQSRFRYGDDESKLGELDKLISEIEKSKGLHNSKFGDIFTIEEPMSIEDLPIENDDSKVQMGLFYSQKGHNNRYQYKAKYDYGEGRDDSKKNHTYRDDVYNDGVEINTSDEKDRYGGKEDENFNENISFTHSPTMKGGERGYLAYEEFEEITSGNSRHNAQTSTIFEETAELIGNKAAIANSENIVSETLEGFTNNTNKNLINRFHTESIDKNGSGDAFEGGARQFETSLTSTYGFSRGRNLLKVTPTTDGGYDNPYCRVWTQRHQYAKMKDRIRPFLNSGNTIIGLESLVKDMNLLESLRPNEAGARLGHYSVLQDNGFVKITSTKDDDTERESIKKYMFSIENLAWRDAKREYNLSADQWGPNGGRIMWFPPYNLKFNDNANVEWNANQFIGRGEKIYTYTDTERHGTLSFTLLIDHPSIINKWAKGIDESSAKSKYEAEQELLRFFAGCGVLEAPDAPLVPAIVKEREEVAPVEEYSSDPVLDPYKLRLNYVMFFPNNYSGSDELKTDSIAEMLFAYDSKTKKYSDTAYKSQILLKKNIEDSPWEEPLNDTDKWGDKLKNRIVNTLGLEDEQYVYTLSKMMNDLSGKGMINFENVKITKITCVGNASAHGYQETLNHTLAKDRAATANKLVKLWGSLINFNETELEIIEGNANVPTEDSYETRDVNKLPPRIGRSAIVTIDVEMRDENMPSEGDGTTTKFLYDESKLLADSSYIGNGGRELNAAVVTAEREPTYTKQRLENEYEYFSKIKENDPLIFKNITDKIKYFDPAFHSITPEGFNSRLTFLHQCTRQGPTKAIDENSSSRAGNLAFGRAPYCILRIGDFFHSKILIESVTMDFDGGAGGIQYDLNPEGIGVQPMMANINIAFKFIGGQDIAGPVERLQNAVSFNYYANSSIYDARADYYKRPSEGKGVGELVTYDVMNPTWEED